MLPNSDPETLQLLVHQRQEEVRRSFSGSRRTAGLLAGAARSSAGLARLPLRIVRLRPSRRPA